MTPNVEDNLLIWSSAGYPLFKGGLELVLDRLKTCETQECSELNACAPDGKLFRYATALATIGAPQR
jgi:hypothetical protein